MTQLFTWSLWPSSVKCLFVGPVVTAMPQSNGQKPQVSRLLLTTTSEEWNTDEALDFNFLVQTVVRKQEHLRISWKNLLETKIQMLNYNPCWNQTCHRHVEISHVQVRALIKTEWDTKKWNWDTWVQLHRYNSLRQEYLYNFTVPDTSQSQLLYFVIYVYNTHTQYIWKTYYSACID